MEVWLKELCKLSALALGVEEVPGISAISSPRFATAPVVVSLERRFLCGKERRLERGVLFVSCL